MTGWNIISLQYLPISMAARRPCLIVCGRRSTRHCFRAMSAPWPEVQSSGNEVYTLRKASQDLAASFATSALSCHSRGSDKRKIQIWSVEHATNSSLLNDSSPQSYFVSVRPGSNNETPMFCVTPRARSSIVSFEQ